MAQDARRSKVMDLSQAVSRYVTPGSKLYVSEHSSALVRQVLRQFRGRDPRFTVISSGVQDHTANLVQCGLVESLITTLCTQPYPGSGPYPAVQRAYREGTLKIESWSLLSLVQRLMAGAMGLPFMPTRSLPGSSMAEENADSFRVLSDPFGSGDSCGAVKALNPDVALMHAWAADPDGNVIGAIPALSGDEGWGAKASLDGAIVSVEHVVPPSFIVEHSSLATIPGYMVKAVCPAPMGAHPGPLGHSFGIGMFEPYVHDYRFLADYARALKSPEAYAAWLAEWVLEIADQEHYIKKLGDARIATLKTVRRSETELPSANAVSASEKKYTPSDMMTIAAARKIQERVLAEQLNTLLCGYGFGAFATWLASQKLLQQDYPIEIVIGSGLYGLSAEPGHPHMLDTTRMTTAKVVRGCLDAYGVWVSGKTARCLSVLAAAQIDRFGNLNSTKFSERQFFVGSGGANDAGNAQEVVAVMAQSKSRFVDRVYYVTCPGSRLRSLVSDMGLFEKNTSGEFALTAYFPTVPGANREEKIGHIKSNCGWDLAVSPSCAELPPPTSEELSFLRSFGPEEAA